MTKQTKRGFTLIELLVVISIIGLLSSVVLASVNTARKRAADSKHIQALGQLKRAMELYYDNNGGIYPPAPVANFWNINCWDCPAGSLATYDAGRLAALAPYLSQRPQGVSPALGGWGGYYYKVSADGKNYKISLGSNSINSTANIPISMRDTVFVFGGGTHASIYTEAAKNWVWWN